MSQPKSSYSSSRGYRTATFGHGRYHPPLRGVYPLPARGFVATSCHQDFLGDQIYSAERCSHTPQPLLPLNFSFGAVITLALWLIGIPSAIVWGVLAADAFGAFHGPYIAAAFAGSAGSGGKYRLVDSTPDGGPVSGDRTDHGPSSRAACVRAIWIRLHYSWRRMVWPRTLVLASSKQEALPQLSSRPEGIDRASVSL